MMIRMMPMTTSSSTSVKPDRRAGDAAAHRFGFPGRKLGERDVER